MSLSATISIAIQNRKAIKKLMDSLSIEQLNQIPVGFNNNVLWNCAHIIAVQQSLTYGLCGLSYVVDDKIVKGFARGTKPEQVYDSSFVDNIKTLLFTTNEQLIQDIDMKKFSTFNPLITALKFEISDIESAVAFNLYHEGLHMGQILDIKKFL